MRGPLVMVGYWNRPEETARGARRRLAPHRRCREADDEGYLYIVDRKKDMIISGGFNVYPSEVEDALTSHPSVSSAAVIGVPDERWGEINHRIRGGRLGAGVDGPALQAFVKRVKGSMYAPKKVVVVDSLPRRLSGRSTRSHCGLPAGATRRAMPTDPKPSEPSHPRTRRTPHHRGKALGLEHRHDPPPDRPPLPLGHRTRVARQSVRDRGGPRSATGYQVGMDFVSDEEQAQQFRTANARVMLGLRFHLHAGGRRRPGADDYAFDFARRHPDSSSATGSASIRRSRPTSRSWSAASATDPG